ncbi:efflux RND transporter periplasmic adaptor subunit [Bacillus sp. V3B]|uniref:efflux RND transporter periplasmic adaptor subunit n=1 Tax=Bacillus sp. V3B TaxID=2804915 RepID=UPI002108F2C6|nr:efflux RND transporter periplasmic adaptor subunit [Bacillus sp. V3B]MCQ6274654.1 efflux RND transporter periplasmic adaptor subunit [Bacillus sp. V3B]
MKWISTITIVVAVLLVITNFYLIFKEDSPVARSVYVEKWTSAKEQTIMETIQTDGVTEPLEEQHIYYDHSKGSFAGFSVEKGDAVGLGKSLFFYSTDSYEEAIRKLQSERDSLQQQLDGLQAKWDNLIDLQSNLSLSLLNEELASPTREVAVEIDLYQTEAEMHRLESEIEKYDNQMSSIDERLPYLQAISDINGFVKEINHDLSNPIITIASTENRVKGVLTENEQALIQPRMNVIISLKNRNQTYKGAIQEVSLFPEKEPAVASESQYPFTVVLDEPIDRMAHGTHVDVTIITNEIANAITVPKESIKKTNKKNQLYILHKGKIEKREVTTGLQVSNTKQIEAGLEPGEIISQKTLLYGKGKPTFYTPLKIKQWERGMYKNMRKKEMLKQLGKGFLSF